MSANTFSKIINICNNVMSYQFNIFGITVTLWGLMLFGILLYLVIYVIYKLFSIE